MYPHLFRCRIVILQSVLFFSGSFDLRCTGESGREPSYSYVVTNIFFEVDAFFNGLTADWIVRKFDA